MKYIKLLILYIFIFTITLSCTSKIQRNNILPGKYTTAIETRYNLKLSKNMSKKLTVSKSALNLKQAIYFAILKSPALEKFKWDIRAKDAI